MFNDGDVVGSRRGPDSPSWAVGACSGVGWLSPRAGCSCRLPSPLRKGTPRAVLNPQAASTNRERRGLWCSVSAAAAASVPWRRRLVSADVTQVIH